MIRTKHELFIEEIELILERALDADKGMWRKPLNDPLNAISIAVRRARRELAAKEDRA